MRNLTLILLMFTLALAGGCALVPQKQYVTEAPITKDDGTVIPAGTPVYVDEKGEPTVEATAPDGTERAPWLEPDVDKIEALAKTAESTAGSIPWGVGAIAGIIVGAIAQGALGAAISKRKADRAKADAGLAKTPPEVGPAT